MNNALTLVRMRLREYDFHLLWNGKAMLDWNARGSDTDRILRNDPEATAAMLALLGREAAAASRIYGYDPDEVPDEEALVRYLTALALPWEYRAAVEAIGQAIGYGNDQDYKPADDGSVDIDTLELKKN